MSDRELCVKLLDNVPEYKIGYVLAYIRGITADEEADDAFCERMIENYENDRIRTRIKPSPWKNANRSGGLTDAP